MSKFISQCFLRQKELENLKSSLSSNCERCGEKYFLHPLGKTKYCCKCRFEVKKERKLIAQKNKILLELAPLPGFPTAPFSTREAMKEYLLGDKESKIQCLLCGHWFGTLWMHLKNQHSLTLREYRIHFGIPFSSGHGLAGKKVKKAMSKLGKRRQQEITPEERAEYVKKMNEKSVKEGICKNKTIFYRADLKKSSKAGNEAAKRRFVGKKGVVKCSDCDALFESSLIAALTQSCKIKCPSCRKDARKETVKKYYQKFRSDEERWKAHVKKHNEYMRERRKSVNQDGEAQ